MINNKDSINEDSAVLIIGRWGIGELPEISN